MCMYRIEDSGAYSEAYLERAWEESDEVQISIALRTGNDPDCIMFEIFVYSVVRSQFYNISCTT